MTKNLERNGVLQEMAGFVSSPARGYGIWKDERRGCDGMLKELRRVGWGKNRGFHPRRKAAAKF